MRILSAGMAAVFALGVIVQYNDPDPLRWMLVYGAACALSCWAAVQRSVPILAASALGLVALVWGLSLEAGVYGRVMPAELVEAWEMKDERVETAREAGGLLIVGAWAFFLAGRSWYLRSGSARTDQSRP
ncbi:MAG TPA: transmembrane 220 family protein [Vicinamibacterales bacterium]|nr:transmembrane 220 family protein [Vicinamibacterales bacterium]